MTACNFMGCEFAWGPYLPNCDGIWCFRGPHGYGVTYVHMSRKGKPIPDLTDEEGRPMTMQSLLFRNADWCFIQHSGFQRFNPRIITPPTNAELYADYLLGRRIEEALSFHPEPGVIY